MLLACLAVIEADVLSGRALQAPCLSFFILTTMPGEIVVNVYGRRYDSSTCADTHAGYAQFSRLVETSCFHSQ